MPKPKTKSSNKPKSVTTVTPRRLKPSAYKSFRLSKRIKSSRPKLPSVFKMTVKTVQVLKKNWRLFLAITLIYGLLTVVLVRGLGGSLNLSDLKSSLQAGFKGSYSNLLTGLTLFGALLSSAGASNTQTGGVYQSFLIIIVSLVTIWALRQVVAGHNIKARDAFYKGCYPLVQFILVLLIIGLELLPLVVGSWLYSTVVNNGIAINGVERFTWGILALLLAILSFYLLCSSVFALYIVTLPDMRPIKALRSANALVAHRRGEVLLKIIYLPILLMIVGAVIMVPLILVLTAAAEWIFFILSMFLLIAVHGYMYTLYRELL